MKLFGFTKKKTGRYAGIEQVKKSSATVKKKSKLIRILIITVSVLAALAIGAVALIKFGARPPEVQPYVPKPPQVSQNPDVTQNPEVTPETPPVEGVETVGRKSGVYTFVVLGTDDGNGNTDTIMVSTLDTVKHTLNIVNIPRDTLVNVSWNTKRINSVWANVGIDGFRTKLADVIGYNIDFYMIIDMKAFKALINAVDGVDFEVTSTMNYDDPYQDLHIHFTKGMHHFNGQQALELVRFRGYAAGDIKRIETQQNFLMSAAKQVLSKKSSISITELVDIFTKYVKTDLSVLNMTWLAGECFKLDAENISFKTMPGNYGDSVYQGGGWQSYVTITVDEWITMINETLNPFEREVTLNDLSIMTRNSSGTLYVTDGNWQGSSSWGSTKKPSSSGSSSSSAGKATAAPTVTKSPPPTTAASPSPSQSPSPSSNAPSTAAPPSDNATATDTPPTTEAPAVSEVPWEAGEVSPPPTEAPVVETPPEVQVPADNQSDDGTSEYAPPPDSGTGGGLYYDMTNLT
ncbi:MAG: LCP family protein [Oscillospiraceae bacterium]|jgi:LCP family protein required for cell wall assembly|nr:LCP family protein [Oscillospiraceae bacterium]